MAEPINDEKTLGGHESRGGRGDLNHSAPDAASHAERVDMQPWERNDRLTRAIEWGEFGVRCLLVPFSGIGSEYLVNCLKQDYRRLREGRATYWWNAASGHGVRTKQETATPSVADTAPKNPD